MWITDPRILWSVERPNLNGVTSTSIFAHEWCKISTLPSSICIDPSYICWDVGKSFCLEF